VIMSGDTHPHAYPPIEASSPLPGHNESRIEPPASLRPQYYATLAATLGGMVMGTSIGWSGPALTMLVGNSSATPPSNSSSYFHEFPVTVSQGNFIASLMPAGALVGGLIGGLLISKLGRKGTMMGASVFFALSYLCLAAAQNVWMLFAGRYLCGLSAGITTIATPTYVSETVSPHVRGMLGSCFQLMITIGVLYVDVVGELFLFEHREFIIFCELVTKKDNYCICDKK
jgi:MFS family permease